MKKVSSGAWKTLRFWALELDLNGIAPARGQPVGAHFPVDGYRITDVQARCARTVRDLLPGLLIVQMHDHVIGEVVDAHDVG
jgi:hypothetical protein